MYQCCCWRLASEANTASLWKTCCCEISKHGCRMEICLCNLSACSISTSASSRARRKRAQCLIVAELTSRAPHTGSSTTSEGLMSMGSSTTLASLMSTTGSSASFESMTSDTGSSTTLTSSMSAASRSTEKPMSATGWSTESWSDTGRVTLCWRQRSRLFRLLLRVLVLGVAGTCGGGLGPPSASSSSDEPIRRAANERCPRWCRRSSSAARSQRPTIAVAFAHPAHAHLCGWATRHWLYRHCGVSSSAQAKTPAQPDIGPRGCDTQPFAQGHVHTHTHTQTHTHTRRHAHTQTHMCKHTHTH